MSGKVYQKGSACTGTREHKARDIGRGHRAGGQCRLVGDGEGKGANGGPMEGRRLG